MNAVPPEARPHEIPVLEVRGLRKRYGMVEALRGVDVDLYRGEVLGLVGDNGAGKSTFVKCLAGVHEADGGSIRLEGRLIEFRSPHEGREAGIEVVYQELALAPDLTVWGNIFLGRELRVDGPLKCLAWLDKRAMRRAAQEHLARLKIEISSVNKPIEALSGGQRQAVAIARSVVWGRKVILMDEPTNNLGVAEQQKVLGLTRTLADQNMAVLVVSHNLEHVFKVADRIAVLRHGQSIATARVNDTTPQQVVHWITGLSEISTR